MPTNGQVPGSEGDDPSIAEMTALLAGLARGPAGGRRTSHPDDHRLAAAIPPHIEQLVAQARQVTRTARPAYGFLGGAAPPPDLAEADARDNAAGYFARARILTSAISQSDSAPSTEITQAVLQLLNSALQSARAQLGGAPPVNFPLFQIWVGLNLSCAALIGIITDDILFKGWDSIDGLNLRAWLKKHGADDATLGSGPLRGVYDLVFGYVDGDIEQAEFAAGTAMRGMLSMVFLYKGAIFYKMQAGMGDTMFTPLYQVLKGRGVRFEFFHRVEDVRVDVANNRVTSIALAKQVNLAVPEYDPLVNVLGLPCWPNEPRFEQSSAGDELALRGSTSSRAGLPAGRTRHPRHSRSALIWISSSSGYSVGALREAAPSLCDASPKLSQAFANIKTVQTCAFQLWLKPNLSGLGWSNPPVSTRGPSSGHSSNRSIPGPT